MNLKAEENQTTMRKTVSAWTRGILLCALLLFERCSCAQAVSPLIEEYRGKAEGSISLTNNTSVPMAVVLEPKSFSVTADGNGVYRSLDSGIHIKLSSMSSRIGPGQTYYVFYEAKADRLPAWFTIYSSFSAADQTSGPDVRILLPHTVYIYPKKQPEKEVVEVKQAAFFRETGKIVCDIANNTADLERVEEIRITSDSESITLPGFPLLPGSDRHVEADWKKKEPPLQLALHMDRSTVKVQLTPSH